MEVFCMKRQWFMALALTVLLLASCASMGNFMPLNPSETIIGAVQISFTVRNTLNGREAINILAYVKLLEMAQLQYGQVGIAVDVRDIMWASGQPVDDLNTEYSATGKVIKIQ